MVTARFIRADGSKFNKLFASMKDLEAYQVWAAKNFGIRLIGVFA